MTRNEFIEQLLTRPPGPIWKSATRQVGCRADIEELSLEQAVEVAPRRMAAEVRRYAEALADAAGLVDVPPAPTAPPRGDWRHEADARLREFDQCVETLSRARADADRKAPKRD